MRTIVSTLAISILMANICVAGGRCCGKTLKSRNSCGVAKNCQVVCDVKKVKTTVWVVECEKFCDTLPCCDRGCKSACGGFDSGCGGKSCLSRKRPLVQPKCNKVRCRKKLVKKTITKEVPIYKCVVGCCNDGSSAGSVSPRNDSVLQNGIPTKAPPRSRSVTRTEPLSMETDRMLLQALRLDR